MQNLRITRIQFTDHMNLREEEDQSVGASKKENKILTGANMEIKCRAETEGKAAKRQSHLGIHSIYS